MMTHEELKTLFIQHTIEFTRAKIWLSPNRFDEQPEQSWLCPHTNPLWGLLKNVNNTFIMAPICLCYSCENYDQWGDIFTTNRNGDARKNPTLKYAIREILGQDTANAYTFYGYKDRSDNYDD